MNCKYRVDHLPAVQQAIDQHPKSDFVFDDELIFLRALLHGAALESETATEALQKIQAPAATLIKGVERLQKIQLERDELIHKSALVALTQQFIEAIYETARLFLTEEQTAEFADQLSPRLLTAAKTVSNKGE